MNSAKPTEQVDKTERAVREIMRWKADKKKGKITVHFDGSGDVKAIECGVFIT